MKGLIIFLVIGLGIASRCSDEHVCIGVESCCKDPGGKWACCPYSSGVCCSSSSHCCPAMYTCSTDGKNCVYDPFSFLGQVEAMNALKPAKLDRSEEDNS